QRDKVDVGVRRHRRQGLIGALRGELRSQVLVPGARQGSFGFHLVNSSPGEEQGRPSQSPATPTPQGVERSEPAPRTTRSRPPWARPRLNPRRAARRFLGEACGLYWILAGVRNCLGVTPTRRLKWWQNWLWSQNPARAATSARDRSPPCSRR